MNNIEPKKPRASLLPLILAAVAVLIGLGLIYASDRLSKAQQEHEQKVQAQWAQIQQSLELINKRLEGSDNRIASLQSELKVTQEHVGVTEQELKQARALAQRLRQEQQQTVEQLSQQIAQKASSEQLAGLEKVSEGKFQVVNQDISEVRQEVQSNQADLAQTRDQLSRLGVVVNEQGQLIATNATGLDELRRRGEREFFTFDARKKQRVNVAGISIELRKSDLKKNYADLRIHIDDLSMEKKKVYVNDPINFYGGDEDKVGYELVINNVKKDEIVGYVSVPKVKVPSGTPVLKR